ncbi:MAG: mandelate racemase/muconate lactonizing enzyme family protein [Chloroflexota bacterium]
MKITAADIYDVSLSNEKFRSIWNLAILRLWTDEGIYGVGEVGLAYGVGQKAGLGMLKDIIPRLILGQDPFRVNQLWNKMYRSTFWGKGGGPVVYGAMSAIDCALLDIKGKALGVPMYDLLGGKTRDEIRVYANGWFIDTSGPVLIPCVTPEEYGEAAAATVAEGFNALKYDPMMIDATGKATDPGRVLDKKRENLAVARVKAVREAVGPDVDICVEIHGSLGTTSAIRLGRRLEEFQPMFYEEPVDPMNVKSMKKVSKNVKIPIAGGERLYTRYQFRPFIEKQALDILQPDLGLAGGPTEVKRIAEYGEVYNLAVQPHNCGGPISTAACVQVDASINNFVIQEWFPYRNEIFYSIVEDALEPKVVDSHYTIPDTPGLGIMLNEVEIKKYRIERLTGD